MRKIAFLVLSLILGSECRADFGGFRCRSHFERTMGEQGLGTLIAYDGVLTDSDSELSIRKHDKETKRFISVIMTKKKVDGRKVEFIEITQRKANTKSAILFQQKIQLTPRGNRCTVDYIALKDLVINSVTCKKTKHSMCDLYNFTEPSKQLAVTPSANPAHTSSAKAK